MAVKTPSTLRYPKRLTSLSDKDIKKLKHQAIKEFAEKVKEMLFSYSSTGELSGYVEERASDLLDEVDTILKEYEGGEK